MSALLAACGGFLLAILWMDLIFDVQVLGHRRADGPLPEPVLASIAAYYKRATTDSAPMSRLIARGHGRRGAGQRRCASSSEAARSAARAHPSRSASRRRR